MPTYVPPRGPEDAEIMIVGEAPGRDEVSRGKPFVGSSGQELSRMLREAGIEEYECFITNVLRFQPPGNDENFYITAKKGLGKKNKWEESKSRFLSAVGKDHLRDLENEIDLVRPKVIIPMGDLALWALTGESGITKWRGSICDLTLSNHKCPVIPTLHPAFVQRLWQVRPVVVHDLKRVAQELKKPSSPPDYNFILRPDFHLAQCFLQDQLDFLDEGPLHISCDIETRARQIACIGFAISATDAICIPFMSIERPEGYWSKEEELELTLLIRKLLTHPNIRLSGQNFMYDAQYLAKQWGILPDLWWDTMNMQHVFFPDLPQILKPKSLGFLATFYCKYPKFWKDEGKLWDPAKTPEDQLWNYNCKDAVVTWEVAEAQKDFPARMKVEYPAEFQMKLWKPLVKMMLRGVRQDLEKKKVLRNELVDYLGDLQKEIDLIAGHPLNPRSPTQLKSFFYGDLRQRQITSRKTGTATLNDEALDTIANREPLLNPLIERIQHARSAGVYKSTFLESEVDTDGRMRCSMNLARVRTFRLSTSEDAFGSGMNLQNIPRDDEDRDPNLPSIKSLFIPDEGYTLVDADLDRADLLVVIWEADDEELKQMVRENVDIHAENAKVIGLSRYYAKQFVHATDYRASARKLAILFGKTVHEMEVAQQRWFSAHPGIKQWHRRTEAGLPHVENKFGYRITFFDRPDQLLGKALAWVPQSTVAIVINHGLVNIDQHLPEAQLLLQVHDSLLFQLPTPQVDTLLPKALDLLRIPVPYEDELIIPVSAKTSNLSWGNCEKYEAA